MPLEVAGDESNYVKLILDIEDTYLKCAVLAVEKSSPPPARYDPNVYGYSK